MRDSEGTEPTHISFSGTQSFKTEGKSTQSSGWDSEFVEPSSWNTPVSPFHPECSMITHSLASWSHASCFAPLQSASTTCTRGEGIDPNIDIIGIIDTNAGIGIGSILAWWDQYYSFSFSPLRLIRCFRFIRVGCAKHCSSHILHARFAPPPPSLLCCVRHVSSRADSAEQSRAEQTHVGCSEQRERGTSCGVSIQQWMKILLKSKIWPGF